MAVSMVGKMALMRDLRMVALLALMMVDYSVD